MSYVIETPSGRRTGPFEREDTAQLASILIPLGRVRKEEEAISGIEKRGITTIEKMFWLIDQKIADYERRKAEVDSYSGEFEGIIWALKELQYDIRTSAL